MTTHEGFLRDICENADDDTPRLVYADWIEENGDPERAEFIRVQCRLAKMAKRDPERSALARREAALLAAHRDEWFRAVCGPTEVHGHDFERGFPSVLHLELKQPRLLRFNTEYLFSRSPWRAATLDEVTARRLQPFLDCPGIRSLRELNISGRSGGTDIALQVARCPHLCNLTKLLINDS